MIYIGVIVDEDCGHHDFNGVVVDGPPGYDLGVLMREFREHIYTSYLHKPVDELSEEDAKLLTDAGIKVNYWKNPVGEEFYYINWYGRDNLDMFYAWVGKYGLRSARFTRCYMGRR